MYGRRSEAPFVEEVPILMREKDVSLNQLAAMVGVNYSHLWRVIGRKDNKKVTGDLAERVAVAFELPSDWFPETRQARLFDLLRNDGDLRDRLYDEFVNPRPSR